eukprot:CAMPEP_0179430842 /NCGR_PEP_ID=MMETSP0799-20121207/15874_1 /TAXON_ID=46947 /ORGANISM="Geminigera cryophila, Strain CCMP2564" /LENGTH=253 /DNA_ID=CAMNT_0021207461 /DNA_START=200 /DNA_END=961 /DNA_ORIENTATION=-
MPAKKMGGTLKPEFVEERRVALEKYLQGVVEDGNAAGSPDFRAFIDANRNCTGKLSEAVGTGGGDGVKGAAKSRLQRKVAVLGFMGVGKSAVTIQFTEGHFAEPYSPTIENTFQKLIRHKGVEYQTDILDTAGQDEYQIFHTRYAMGIHGYILMYSIVSRRSFDMVSTIRDKLLNAVGTEDIPHVLVGNKNDLVHEREVGAEEGQRLADEWGVPFIESSAKFNSNVEEVFRKLIATCEQRSEGSEGEKKCSVM